MFRSRAKPCLPLFAAVHGVRGAGWGGGGGSFVLQPGRGAVNPPAGAAANAFAPSLRALARPSPASPGRGVGSGAHSPRQRPLGGLPQPRGLPAHRAGGGDPSASPPAPLHLPAAAGSAAAAARRPRLRSRLETSRFLFYPAPVTFYLHRQRMLGDKRGFFFFLRQRCFIFLEGLCFLLER